MAAVPSPPYLISHECSPTGSKCELANDSVIHAVCCKYHVHIKNDLPLGDCMSQQDVDAFKQFAVKLQEANAAAAAVRYSRNRRSRRSSRPVSNAAVSRQDVPEIHWYRGQHGRLLRR